MFATICRAGLVGLALAGALLCAAPAGTAAASDHTDRPPTAAPAAVSAAPVKPTSTQKGCLRRWWVMGDGVRIHTRPSLRSTVVGLGYTVDIVDVLDTRPGWTKISDDPGIITTGWMVNRFLEPSTWCSASYVPRSPHGVS